MTTNTGRLLAKCVFFMTLWIVILSFVDGQIKIGSCTFKEEALKKRRCYTTFINDLRKNPKADCSNKLDAFITCYIKDVGKACFPNFNRAFLRIIIEFNRAELKDVMCNKAGLQIPASLHRSDLVMIFNGCSGKLVKIWKTNRADPKTCIEYKTRKHCLLRSMKTIKGLTPSDIKDFTKLFSDNYNPFCPNNVDPTSTGASTSAATQFQLTSSSASSTVQLRAGTTRTILPSGAGSTSTPVLSTLRVNQARVQITTQSSSGSSTATRSTPLKRVDTTNTPNPLTTSVSSHVYLTSTPALVAFPSRDGQIQTTIQTATQSGFDSITTTRSPLLKPVDLTATPTSTTPVSSLVHLTSTPALQEHVDEINTASSDTRSIRATLTSSVKCSSFISIGNDMHQKLPKDSNSTATRSSLSNPVVSTTTSFRNGHQRRNNARCISHKKSLIVLAISMWFATRITALFNW